MFFYYFTVLSKKHVLIFGYVHFQTVSNKISQGPHFSLLFFIFFVCCNLTMIGCKKRWPKPEGYAASMPDNNPAKLVLKYDVEQINACMWDVRKNMYSFFFPLNVVR